VQTRLDVFEKHLDAYTRDIGVDDLIEEDLADWFRQVDRAPASGGDDLVGE
jgi:hypothetical protein